MKTAEWGKDKPLVLGMIAQQIASSAESLHQLNSSIKNENGPLADSFKLPPLPIWLRLYTDHRAVLQFMQDLFMLFPFGAFLLEFGELLILLQRTPPDKLNKVWRRLPLQTKENLIRSIQEQANEIQRLHLEDFKDDFQVDLDLSLAESLKELFNRPEAAFYYRIYAPCLLTCGLPPVRMLRKISKGDLGALETMLDSTIPFFTIP